MIQHAESNDQLEPDSFVSGLAEQACMLFGFNEAFCLVQIWLKDPPRTLRMFESLSSIHGHLPASEFMRVVTREIERGGTC